MPVRHQPVRHHNSHDSHVTDDFASLAGELERCSLSSTLLAILRLTIPGQCVLVHGLFGAQTPDNDGAS